jgi:transposase-like protein
MPKYKICPLCGTVNSTIKHGRTKNGTQRFKCKSCTGTFLQDESTTSYLNNSDYVFKRFIGFMIDDVTLEVIARNLNIDIKTALYYRYLIFESLRDYQDEVFLDGTILVDETFVRISDKRYKLFRPDGKGIRGISFNHLCVITLISLEGKTIAKVSSRGNASPKKFIDLCTKNVGEVTKFIHDGSVIQKQFMRQFDVPNYDARRECDGKYDTLLVDSLHSNIKRYLFKHAGYRLKNLQHYMNFFVYRYNHTPKSKHSNNRQIIESRNSMIDDLYRRVKNIKKRITYRNFQSDPGITDILESVSSDYYEK